MIDKETFKTLALSFPDTEELPHFEKLSYRWHKKIFATLDVKLNKGMVQLSVIDQDVFCAFNGGFVFYPVPNAWGKSGSTFINLDVVLPEMLKDALNCAYLNLINKQKRKS